MALPDFLSTTATATEPWRRRGSLTARRRQGEPPAQAWSKAPPGARWGLSLQSGPRAYQGPPPRLGAPLVGAPCGRALASGPLHEAHELAAGLGQVAHELVGREVAARQPVSNVAKDCKRLGRDERDALLCGLLARVLVRVQGRRVRQQHQLAHAAVILVARATHRVNVAEHAVEDTVGQALGGLAPDGGKTQVRHERRAFAVERHNAHSLRLLGGALRRPREQVGLDEAHHEHGEQEDGELERLVPEARQGHLREVDHDHSDGLADVLLDRVQRLEQIHGADSLDHEGCCHHPGRRRPVGEEAVGHHLRIHHAGQQRGQHPRGGQARDLCRQRHVLVLLQVLFRQHRAVAGGRHLEQRAQDGAHGHRAGAAAAVGAAHVHQHESAGGDEQRDQHVPLQGGLPGALEPPHQQGSDQQLRLQQSLVHPAAERGHGQHLQGVPERVHSANHPEDGQALRLPALPDAGHAVAPERRQVHQDDRQELVHEYGRIFGVEDLAALLRGVDEQRMQGARGDEEHEEAQLHH
mmetsp:Transcript_2968/g.8201  ORF Transcript_2968/g.8201 Transcript_2968/m.8201 type:complete len:524 (+) Transcript_2968:263-1834(+)